MDKAQEILARIQELFPSAQRVFEGQISPALVVHTGPGLVGIGIQGLEKAHKSALERLREVTHHG
jgi:fatty acid-binding protein DegV